MPDFPIIDSHIHLFDIDRLGYSWTRRLPPAMQRSRSLADFRAASGGIAVERVVFMEFLVDRGQHLDEAAYGQGLANADPQVGAVVAHVPVEKGEAVAADLEVVTALPAVRGIRRIFEDANFSMALEPDFIAGVRTVGRFGLPFEIGVRHWGLVFALELARRCPEVTFVLDHLATPGIKHGLREPWWTQIREFGRLPNVIAKISGVMAGVDPKKWAVEDIVPYLTHALECFGFERAMFGSDWPMCEMWVPYAQWLEIVERTVAGASPAEKRALYRDTAIRHYRLAV